VPKKDAPGKKPASRVGKLTVKRPVVSYRFNEGNSAAVRKPIKVAAFL
jgi:chromosome transmission fidelity protein 18